MKVLLTEYAPVTRVFEIPDEFAPVTNKDFNPDENQENEELWSAFLDWVDNNPDISSFNPVALSTVDGEVFAEC